MTQNPATTDRSTRAIAVRATHDPRSLWRWLSNDPDAGQLLTCIGGPPDDEQQGTFEVINTLVANGLALSGLTVAIAGWRAQRKPEPPTVTLERDGVSVKVTDASPEQIAAIAKALGIPENDEPA